MIYRIPDDPIIFPNPAEAEPDGLLAIGGDLRPERLILAYQHGIFPWFDFHEPEPLWYCPHKRFVIFPGEIHISHSMRTLINKRQYRCYLDRDFDSVIDACGKLREDKAGAWLGEDMRRAYKELHRLGHAHSVGVYDSDDRLVGGLYGVMVSNIFCGESMFSLVPSASKLALIYLAKILPEGTAIDCQLETAHLKSMGGRFIPYAQYMEIAQGGEEENINSVENQSDKK